MILGLLYTIFLVPETIVSRVKVPFFSFSYVRNTLELFVRGDTQAWPHRRRNLALLLVVFAIANMCMMGAANVFNLFMMNEPLCWGSTLIGIFLFVYIGSSSIGAAIAAKLLRLCARDQTIALVAVISSILDRIYAGSVQNTLMMFLSKLLFSSIILFCQLHGAPSPPF